MGGCLSKKKLPSTPKEKEKEKDKKYLEKKKPVVSSQQAQPAAAEKKTVFVVNQTTKKTPIATVHKEKDEKKGETPIKRMQKDGERFGIEVAVAAEDRAVSVPVRTSSCSKEELDAILIQCGRLSRSSSGKAANEASVVRRYSGSKRSYDFDEERRRGDEEDCEKPVSRPSPRRRTLSRERDGCGEYKRSGSRERGNSDGKRRVSRSPGRRSDGPASSNSVGDRLKPPAKMVSVPAREKDGAVAAETGRNVVKRASSPAMSKLRSQSPRSRSPANTRPLNENSQHSNYPQPQSLSRSSSRKAEQSPYRRSPMAELDDNSLKAEQNPSRRTGRSQSQKASEGVAQARKPEPRNSRSGEISSGVKSSNNITNCVREQLLSCRAPAKLPTSEIEEEVPEVEGTMKANEIGLNPRSITRTRSSRRSSRDLDNCYNSLLLEDIQNYHQNGTIVSLPACVSKACSILEAVADLNTSSSDNKSHEGEGYSNADNLSHNGTTLVKDDFVPSGLHKYVTIRRWEREMEPQESAGSNSFAGQPWASPWEPNSVESSDRCWSSRSNTTREESAHEEEQAVPDAPGGRVSGGSSTGSLPAATTPSGKKREFDHRQLQRHSTGIVAAGNEKVTSRANSAAAAAASS